MALLEIACFSPDSAIVASEAGADRIELCADQHAGGTTPPFEWLRIVKAKVSIPVFVMIRPRGGDFVYSDHEYHCMKADIDQFKPIANGFVFGILDHDRRVDVTKTAELVQRAHPLPCTFHRAFDETRDPLEAFEHVVAAGCHAILSSGGAPSANGGINILKTLVDKAQGRIAVMPGGGVRSANLTHMRSMIGAAVYHSSAVSKGNTLPDAVEIRRMKEILRGAEIYTALPSPTKVTLEVPADDSASVSAVSIGEGATPDDGALKP